MRLKGNTTPIVMKAYFVTILSVIGLSLFALTGCIQDKCSQQITYFSYEPVYMTFEELRASGKTEAPRALERPGKLYYKDGYIFINEVGKGIHVVDNHDLSNPTNIAFINIPGNHDLAAKGNVLYADSYTDLVAIDISNPANTSVLSRVENVFPYGMWHDGLYADVQLGIAIDWIETEVTEEFPCEKSTQGIRNILPRNGFVMEDAQILSAASSNTQFQSQNATGGGEVSTGVGGSLARFTILNDYLYTVTPSELKVFGIAQLDQPVPAGEIYTEAWTETLFPFEGHLLVGSQTGMFIYSLDDPTDPKLEGEFAHVQSCDPVVAEGDYAYVTLWGGSPCQGFVNQLDILDISNFRKPKLLHSFPMYEPKGLGIRNGILFICDGDDGLKIFDASDPATIPQNRIAHFPNINALDVIPLHNVLLMIGKDGFYQYDYSDLNDIKLLSKIEILQ